MRAEADFDIFFEMVGITPGVCMCVCMCVTYYLYYKCVSVNKAESLNV